jgi:hypothetical protein
LLALLLLLLETNSPLLLLLLLFQQFMTEYEDNWKKVGVYLEETFLPLRPPNAKFLKRQTKRDKDKNVIVSIRRFRPVCFIDRVAF